MPGRMAPPCGAGHGKHATRASAHGAAPAKAGCSGAAGAQGPDQGSGGNGDDTGDRAGLSRRHGARPGRKEFSGDRQRHGAEDFAFRSGRRSAVGHLKILCETSSRVEPLMPEIRKTGILFTQTVMGPTGEAAVVGFNDSVDKLQDFTTNAEEIENTIASLRMGTSGSKLFDAMAVGVEMLTSRPQATAEKPGRRRVMLILSEASDEGSEIGRASCRERV